MRCDALRVMEQHIDFIALAAERGAAPQPPSVSNRVEGARAGDRAIVELERRADRIPVLDRLSSTL